MRKLAILSLAVTTALFATPAMAGGGGHGGGKGHHGGGKGHHGGGKGHHGGKHGGHFRGGGWGGWGWGGPGRGWGGGWSSPSYFSVAIYNPPAPIPCWYNIDGQWQWHGYSYPTGNYGPPAYYYERDGQHHDKHRDGYYGYQGGHAPPPTGTWDKQVPPAGGYAYGWTGCGAVTVTETTTVTSATVDKRVKRSHHERPRIEKRYHHYQGPGSAPPPPPPPPPPPAAGEPNNL